MEKAPRTRLIALRASLLILGLVGVWFFLSDPAMRAILTEPDRITRFEVYSGLAFVMATSLLLYLALRGQLVPLEVAADERQHAVESLATRELHLSVIRRSALDGYWLIDRTGLFLEVNDAYCAISGYERDELLRMRLADVDTVETEAEVAARLARIERMGADRFETRHRRKDGRVIDLEVGVGFAEMEGGRFVGFCRDITQRNQVERVMRHQELLLREAGEIAHLGAWEFDPVTLRGSWTAECARIHDLEPTQEASAQLGLSCFQGESRSRIEAVVREAIELGKPYDLELELTTPKGNRKWVRTICHPVVEGGRTVRVRGAIQDLTERKRTEDALRESEQKYRRLVDHASEAIYVVQDEIIQFANRACAQCSGASQDSLVGRSILDFVPLEDRPRVKEHHWRMISGENTSASSEFRLRTVHGKVVWFAVNSVRIAWKGRPATLSLATDITERKRSEEALRASEERLRLAAEAAQMGTWDRDLRTGRLYWSAHQQRLMGYEPGTFPGTPEAYLALLHPDTLALHAEQQRRARTGDGLFHAELKFRLRDGSERWGLVCGQTKFDAAGKPVRILGIQIDITERKRAEEQLHTLSRAVEQSPVSIVITDPTGAIEYVNPRFCELTGYTADEVRGKNPRVLKSGEMPPERYRDLWQTLTEGREWRGEFHNRKKNGELYWEFASISPILDEAGRTTHFLAVKEDITARKQAEAERQRLEAELREAHKMEAIGTLAGGIAHDFNNILGAILGNAQLAATEVESDHPAGKSLDEIVKASRRAKDLVNQILAFSRRQPLHRQVMSLQPVVEEGLQLLRAALPAKVELVASLTPGSPSVWADSSQIHQVVLNLGTNAWHALENGSGRIEIGLRGVTAGPDAEGELAELPPGDYACLSVTDTGRGMNVKTLSRIFDPFYTTKAPGQGTGLGLAVVDGIVRNHEGRIRVSSAPRQGTSVRIYLPAVAWVVDTPGQRLSGRAAPQGRGRRVLYMDDEEPLMEVTSRLLVRLGYDVAGFNRVDEALSAFRANPTQFDLAIADFNMPGQNGLQVAAELLACRPELPVVLCSGYVTQDLEAEGRRLGVRSWLSKPTPIEELSQTLEQLWPHPNYQ